MKTFFNILSIVLGIYFLISMIGTDDVGEKVEYATIAILCYLSLISNSLYEIGENES
jgi:hypothetical protein